MAKINDLTGQQFGELKVISRDTTRKERAYWLCECSCGKKITVSGTKLRQGQQSCGCLNSRQIKPLQRFGRLIALEPTKLRSNKGNIIWKCQCDCGNIVNVRKDLLLNGHTKSCGCLKREVSLQNLANPINDLRGQVFGKLTVKYLDLPRSQKDNKNYWICSCECGNQISVRADHLNRKEILSCGCSKASNGEILIEKYLKDNNINYQKEYSFKELRDKLPLRFDFALFAKENADLVCLIEVDGAQHYIETNYYFSDTLEKRQYRDNLKNEYCIKSNIPLFRIPYNQLKNITSIQDIFVSQFLYQTKGEQ